MDCVTQTMINQCFRLGDEMACTKVVLAWFPKDCSSIPVKCPLQEFYLFCETQVFKKKSIFYSKLFYL